MSWKCINNGHELFDEKLNILLVIKIIDIHLDLGSSTVKGCTIFVGLPHFLLVHWACWLTGTTGA